ncbi:hypothetical protein L4D76_00590 [Photobacterium sagamiensis]|uniref:hypothetical protein n=1 Tax=Photobacterium sagamiensis TaxID=2910241 RepID=UPI003D1347D5
MTELRDEIINSVRHLDQINYLYKCDVDIVKLKAERCKILEALAYYCPESSFSDLVIDQLSMISSHKYVELGGKLYPYILLDVLHRMRLVEVNKPDYKPFKRNGSPLKGTNLYHVHHSLHFEMIFNFIRYFEKTYHRDELIFEQLNQLYDQYPNRTDHMAIFVKDEMIKSVEWDVKNKTGEWLMYQIINNQIHFVALALHQTDDLVLFELIQSHLK